jgi:hypothetical protein
MKKNLLYLILFVGGTLISLQAQNHISFFEEHIDFTLDNTYFTINGIYSFHNSANKEVSQPIIFPFADKASTIDSIRITNLSSGRKIKFDRLDSSVSFNFMLQPNDTVDLNIFYRQKMADINKYIITSTQSWGKPLEIAVYSLTTANDLKIKSFSYAPDSVRVSKNKKIYYWNKHQFMPKFEFEITIET